ncbi:hypothetical protein EYZ11_005761 [Aspergillus tanneri]|uniref:Uncharacterized protein n=1 Tax=Aspergillus tanneri TaxID=1220188 RepID=A0A4S3JH71_9EURO|nr:hypothetical protein EYZ11_005761 [Aspergillus tanneri]
MAEPFLSIADKSVGDTNFHTLFDEEVGTNVGVKKLTKVKAVFQHYVTRFPNIFPEILGAYLC